MARVEILSTTQTSATVRIVELQYRQNTYGGFRVRITNQTWYNISVTNSTSYATSSYTIHGLSPGTTTAIEGQGQSNGTWYSVSSTYATTQPPTPVRPSNWYWYSSKYSGGNFNITAYEWNSFCSKINEFRDYKGLSYYYFSYAYSGYNFTASHYNEARNAIYSMHSYIPPYRSSGDIIYASDINQLGTTLNLV